MGEFGENDSTWCGQLLNRGDILFVDMGIQPEGSIQGGLRPVVVISNNLANKFSPVVTVVDFVRKNPARGITVKRDEEKEIKVLTVEEQALFFDCCKGTFYDNFFITAVATGMRIGEIAALREEDIDFDKKVIHVSRTLVYAKYEEDTQKTFHFEAPKTKTSNRTIPINKQCFMALKKQIMQKRIVTNKAPKSKMPEQQFRNLIFTTSFNMPINSQIIMDAIKKIVNEINLTRDPLEEMELFSCHAFRHTFATRCFEAGIKTKTVQAYLGHASLQMTMDLYTSVLPEHLDQYY